MLHTARGTYTYGTPAAGTRKAYAPWRTSCPVPLVRTAPRSLVRVACTYSTCQHRVPLVVAGNQVDGVLDTARAAQRRRLRHEAWSEDAVLAEDVPRLGLQRPLHRQCLPERSAPSSAGRTIRNPMQPHATPRNPTQPHVTPSSGRGRAPAAQGTAPCERQERLLPGPRAPVGRREVDLHAARVTEVLVDRRPMPRHIAPHAARAGIRRNATAQ